MLWFIFSYIVFLMVSTLIAVYGFEFRVGMEMQRYSATFAVKLFFIFIMISAVVAGVGFFVGVILFKCRRERQLGILLGIIYGILALLSMIYSNFIVSLLGIYSSVIIWPLGFLGSFMLPYFAQMKKLTKSCS